MTLFRLLLHPLRRSTSSLLRSPSTTTTTTTVAAAAAFHALSTLTATINTTSFPPITTNKSEAQIARDNLLRKRKRDNRIQPPLHALRRDPTAPRPPPDPNAPRLPDTTSALTGARLNLHNRVQSLIRGGDLDAAAATARQAVYTRTRPTVFTCNAIIASMYRASRYHDSVSLFQFFFNQSNIVPNIVSYNNLINAYCDTNRVDVALEVYRHIIANAPFVPSSVTFRHLTKGLIDADRTSEAMDLLREMLAKGHGADSLVYNNLIAGYLNLGNLERASELFDELRERCLVYDGVVNATFMEWFFKKGMNKEAMESYQSLLDRNFTMTPATCNVLLEVLLRYGKSAEANALFETMLNKHKTPNVQAVNSQTYNIMVNECFRLGKGLEALAVFRQVGTAEGSKPFMMDGAGYTNMIGKLCENDMVGEADKLFQEMCNKSVVMDYNTYRHLIEAYFREDRVDDVVRLFNKFLFESNLKANPHFFNMVFGGMIIKGRSEEAGDILRQMGEREGEMKPDPSTYELVISALCKEGNLDHSLGLLSHMLRYKVGVTPTLRSSIDEAFGKEGRIDQVEKLLGRPHQTKEGAFDGAMPSSIHQPREWASPRAPSLVMH